MPLFLQDVVVIGMVLAAAVVVGRRLFWALKPRSGQPACDSCALADVMTETAKKSP